MKDTMPYDNARFGELPELLKTFSSLFYFFFYNYLCSLIDLCFCVRVRHRVILQIEKEVIH